MPKITLLSICAAPFHLLKKVVVFVWLRIWLRIWRRLRMVSLVLMLVLVLAGLAQIAAMAQLTEWGRQQVYYGTAFMGFAINDITVEGRKRTRREDLLAAANVRIGKPIFAVNLAIMQARMEALPWIQSAAVFRQLPNILHIRLVEREPFARYMRRKKRVLIDRQGDAIDVDNVQGFGHLPIFSGLGAPVRAASLMDLLNDYPALRNRLTAAHWINGRRWVLHLNQGGKVHLPARDVAAALDRLMALQRQRRILAIKNQAIDLRLPDRILLRPERSDRKRRKVEVAS